MTRKRAAAIVFIWSVLAAGACRTLQGRDKQATGVAQTETDASPAASGIALPDSRLGQASRSYFWSPALAQASSQTAVISAIAEDRRTGHSVVKGYRFDNGKVTEHATSGGIAFIDRDRGGPAMFLGQNYGAVAWSEMQSGKPTKLWLTFLDNTPTSVFAKEKFEIAQVDASVTELNFPTIAVKDATTLAVGWLEYNRESETATETFEHKAALIRHDGKKVLKTDLVTVVAKNARDFTASGDRARLWFDQDGVFNAVWWGSVGPPTSVESNEPNLSALLWQKQTPQGGMASPQKLDHLPDGLDFSIVGKVNFNVGLAGTGVLVWEEVYFDGGPEKVLTYGRLYRDGTFDAPVLLTDREGSQAKIAAARDRGVVVWTANPEGKRNTIFYRTYDPSGFQETRELTRDGTAYYPDVAVNAAGDIFVAWLEKNQGTPFEIWGATLENGEWRGIKKIAESKEEDLTQVRAAVGEGRVASVVWVEASGLWFKQIAF